MKKYSKFKLGHMLPIYQSVGPTLIGKELECCIHIILRVGSEKNMQSGSSISAHNLGPQ